MVGSVFEVVTEAPPVMPMVTTGVLVMVSSPVVASVTEDAPRVTVATTSYVAPATRALVTCTVQVLAEMVGVYETPFTVTERTSPEILVQVPPTKGVVSLVERVCTVGLFNIVTVVWLVSAS